MTIKGIVFDKDGTLFEYQGTWAAWCRAVIADLSGNDAALATRLAAAVGFNAETDDFVPGSLIVNGAAGDVNAAWAAHLPAMSLDDVNTVAIKNLENLPDLPVCDLTALFDNLVSRGIALGLATNDYEAAAYQQLRSVGVVDQFDFVCGFDSGHGAKPGPGMIEAFCQATGLLPSAVAMVGDSTHDLGAGRAASVGATIGVLTGPARADDIAHLADHIVADISAIPALLDSPAFVSV